MRTGFAKIVFIVGAVLAASTMVQAKESIPNTVMYDGHKYPVAAVNHGTMSDEDFCTLLTGVWCEGTIGLPKPDALTTFNSTSAYYWSVEVIAPPSE